MVAYTDIPKSFLVANNADGFFDGVRDEFIKEAGGKLASESPLSVDGHPGREIKVHLFRGELRLRLFLVGDRLYILSLTNLDKGSESDEETPNKFFGSFKLNPITKRIAASPVRQEDFGTATFFYFHLVSQRRLEIRRINCEWRQKGNLDYKN